MCTDDVCNVNVVAKVIMSSSRNINFIPRTKFAWVLVHRARCRYAWLEPGSAGPLLLYYAFAVWLRIEAPWRIGSRKALRLGFSKPTR